MTSSTVSRESAFRSLMKCVSRVISLLSTPICSETISMTLFSMSSIIPMSYPGVSLLLREPRWRQGGKTILGSSAISTGRGGGGRWGRGGEDYRGVKRIFTGRGGGGGGGGGVATRGSEVLPCGAGCAYAITLS